MKIGLILGRESSDRRGKTVDRSRLIGQVLTGANGWHDQRKGLEGLAIEVVAHRLRSEGLPLRSTFGGIRL